MLFIEIYCIVQLLFLKLIKDFFIIGIWFSYLVYKYQFNVLYEQMIYHNFLNRYIKIYSKKYIFSICSIKKNSFSALFFLIYIFWLTFLSAHYFFSWFNTFSFSFWTYNLVYVDLQLAHVTFCICYKKYLTWMHYPMNLGRDDR